MSPHAVDSGSVRAIAAPELWIAGLGSQYPPKSFTPDKFEEFASRFHDLQSPGLRKLLAINRRTGIQTRASVSTYDDGFGAQSKPPTISECDRFFREVGVELAAQACGKALKQWGGDKGDITHTVAVTCSNQGNPGYDLLVNQALGLNPSVDRTLLHGVGCAGGLAIMRAAAQIASGSAARGKPARVLAFACELCTPNVRFELARVDRSAPEDVSIGSALFSDGAAAFVLCNSIGLGEETEPEFQLLEWATATLPDTAHNMSYCADPYGYRLVLTRDVPVLTSLAVKPMFSKMVPDYSAHFGNDLMREDDFDWALHPGGEAIIDGVKRLMHLTEHQLRATREIYRTKGNSSSPSVLIVLDKLRSMGKGSDHVVATSFGTGLAIEMALLRRCRNSEADVTF